MDSLREFENFNFGAGTFVILYFEPDKTWLETRREDMVQQLPTVATTYIEMTAPISDHQRDALHRHPPWGERRISKVLRELSRVQ